METFSVIITAGGIGKRMGSSLPKQFLEINGLPVLMHTIHRFYEFDPHCQIIVTLPIEWSEHWKSLLEKHQFPVCHQIVNGGIERYDSIKNALEFCQNEYIAVHDGVRPFVSDDTIQRCLDLTLRKGNAIPVLALKESIRKLHVNGTSEAARRTDFVSVQTPQFFRKEMLEKAYEIPYHSAITDDASLVEEAGYVIHLTEGNEENIKITTPLDLKWGALFLIH